MIDESNTFPNLKCLDLNLKCRKIPTQNNRKDNNHLDAYVLSTIIVTHSVSSLRQTVFVLLVHKENISRLVLYWFIKFIDYKFLSTIEHPTLYSTFSSIDS